LGIYTGVVGIVDAIHYFKATDSEFVEKYLNNKDFQQWD
jgi:hypothetical protein